MIDMSDFLLAILDKRKYGFLKLKTYQSQADYLKKILSKNKDKRFSKILKMEIRWREKIDRGEDYDSDRIRNYVNNIKSDQGKIDYLRLARKNIKNQILAQDNPDIFQLKGEALILKSPNSELNDFINLYSEFFRSRNAKLDANSIEKLLSDRLFVLKSISKEIKNEIKYYKGKQSQDFDATGGENPKTKLIQPKINKSKLTIDNKIDDLTKKLRYILKTKDIKDEVLKKSEDEKFKYMKQLLKKKFPDLTDNQFLGSKRTLIRYLRDDWIKREIS